MFDLSEHERSLLLGIARKSIEEFLNGSKYEPDEPESEILKKPCGAFVTLKIQDNLRGCIGSIVASDPLYMTVSEMAVSSASRDPRFSPVSREDMENIDIEISVLSPFEKISNISEINIGEHGIMIRQLLYHGLLLPQVATEYNWNRQQFLEHTCMKAGLPRNAWKDQETEIQIFSAVVFGEKS